MFRMSGLPVFMSPDDGATGGSPEGAPAVDQQQPAQPTLDKGVTDLLGSMGVSLEAASKEQIAEALYKSRGAEIDGRKSEREKRQRLEKENKAYQEQLSTLGIAEILGTEGIPDNAKDQIKAINSRAQKLSQTEEALGVLAEAGVLPDALVGALQLGTPGVQAYLAGLQAGGGSRDANGLAQQVADQLKMQSPVGGDAGNRTPANLAPLSEEKRNEQIVREVLDGYKKTGHTTDLLANLQKQMGDSARVIN